MRYGAFVSLVIFVGLVCFGSGAFAQGVWPSKPVRLVLPFALGGSTEALSRMIANEMTRTFGQPVVIEPRAGSGGVIAVDSVVKSAPDGYTIMLVTNGAMVISPSLRSDLSYDPVRDVAPIGMIASVPMVIAVPAASPFQSLGDLIAAARAKPGSLAYAHTGVATTPHLSGELLKHLARIEMTHVPYKGSVLVAGDLLAGQVPVGITDIVSVLIYARAGRVRMLAVIAARRSAVAPDVPTVAETVPGFDVQAWYGLATRAGVPREIIVRINAELNRIMALPEVRDRSLALGMEPLTGTPDEFAALIRSEIPKWAQVVKLTGVKIE